MSERRPPPADDDLPRDERLLQALRHAPDHDVEPPPALSAHILASARAAAVQSAQVPRAGRWWSRVLDAVAPPRTPWAPAFGTVVVAVLVGVLWSTTRVDEPAAGDAEPPPAQATARDGPPQPSPTQQRMDDTAPPPAAASPAPPAPAAPRPPAAQSARERAVAPPAGPAAAKSEAARNEAATAPRSAAPAAAPAPPAAPSPAAAPTAPPVRETAPLGASAERRADAAESAPRSAAADRLGAAARSADPIVRLDAALAARPDEVSWRHALRTHFHEAPQRRWWAQLRDETHGRWRAVPESRRESVPPWVTVSVGGQRVAIFWFEGDALWLRDDAGLWRVPATAAQQRAWQAGLVTW